mmetsp:Transcript_18976/g.41343  ORF Transcript_18976/g.41343 Transcript_18976/m.41343 type:complete len:115 (+) Transcript_18976:87-431(+)
MQHLELLASILPKQPVEDATINKTSILRERRTSLHVRVGQVRTDRSNRNQRIRRPQQLLVVIRRQLLPPLKDCPERNDRRPFLYPAEVIPMLGKETAVTVPTGEGVMTDEQGLR